jgi:hypothetical protein
MSSTVGRETKLPRFGTTWMSPSASSRCSACRTGVRLRPKSAATLFSLMRSRGRRVPVMIASFSRS